MVPHEGLPRQRGRIEGCGQTPQGHTLTDGVKSAQVGRGAAQRSSEPNRRRGILTWHGARGEKNRQAQVCCAEMCSAHRHDPRYPPQRSRVGSRLPRRPLEHMTDISTPSAVTRTGYTIRSRKGKSRASPRNICGGVSGELVRSRRSLAHSTLEACTDRHATERVQHARRSVP